jgi:RNA polymerase sigma factor (sigma-70 family)
LFRRPREAPLPPEAETILAADPGFDRVTDRRVVTQALSQLPLRQRQVVVLRFFEDLSVEDTAETLGFSTGTVKSYTSRALSRLRELLAEEESFVEVSDAHR